MRHTDTEVFELIRRERKYQDLKYAKGIPCPPSDELRIIRALLAQADQRWYSTPDELRECDSGAEGPALKAKVNQEDLDAMRKIAAVAVRCLQRWGCVEREGGYDPSVFVPVAYLK